MIRQFWWGMGQFCRSCHERGESFEDAWWPITDEFWNRRYQDTRVVQWFTQCKACQSEKQAERKVAMREAA